MMNELKYYGVTDRNGRKVFKKEGQWLTRARAEELAKEGYIVTLQKTNETIQVKPSLDLQIRNAETKAFSQQEQSQTRSQIELRAAGR